MDNKKITTIAADAIRDIRAHYGERMWDYAHVDIRKGWVAREIVVRFATFSPSSKADEVADAVKISDDMIDAAGQ